MLEDLTHINVQNKQLYRDKVTAKGYRASFCGEENVLKLNVVIAAQFSEYTKNH